MTADPNVLPFRNSDGRLFTCLPIQIIVFGYTNICYTTVADLRSFKRVVLMFMQVMQLTFCFKLVVYRTTEWKIQMSLYIHINSDIFFGLCIIVILFMTLFNINKIICTNQFNIQGILLCCVKVSTRYNHITWNIMRYWTCCIIESHFHLLCMV